MLERRRVRSTDPSEALQLLLEAHRERLEVQTLVLARPDGRLLGGAGRDPGSVAAVVVDEERGGPGSSAVATWRLRAGGDELVIASLGGRLSPDIGDDVRRILG
jgi:hypothetical protein